MPFESVWRRMAPDAYLDTSMVIAKGEERSGMCRTGCERKRCLS